MKQKKRKITDKDQRIVAEILTMLMFTETMEEVRKICDSIYKAFELCDDPFTGCPCSCKEAAENRLEKEKQIMIDRYGHCDGLE